MSKDNPTEEEWKEIEKKCPGEKMVKILSFYPVVPADGHDLGITEEVIGEERTFLVCIQTRTKEIRLWRRLTEGEAHQLMNWLQGMRLNPNKE